MKSKRKSFTSQEEKLISFYRSKGCTCFEIAQIMGRSVCSIKGKLQRHTIYGPIEESKRATKTKNKSRRSINSCDITEFWESALKKLRVKVKKIDGQKIFFIDNNPVSVFTILNMIRKE